MFRRFLTYSDMSLTTVFLRLYKALRAPLSLSLLLPRYSPPFSILAISHSFYHFQWVYSIVRQSMSGKASLLFLSHSLPRVLSLGFHFVVISIGKMLLHSKTDRIETKCRNYKRIEKEEERKLAAMVEVLSTSFVHSFQPICKLD